jgi:hypothetical protein
MQSPPEGQTHDESGPDVPGVVDTIGLAFTHLNRRPYLIWIPVVLDALVWIGFRMSSTDPIGALASVRGRGSGSFADTDSIVRERVAEIDLVQTLSLLIPNLLNDPRGGGVPGPTTVGEVSVDGAFGAGLLAVSLAGMVLLGMTYLNLIGRLVSGTPARGLSFVWDCVRTSAKAVGVAWAALCLLAFMMLPLGLISAGLWLVGVDPLSLLILTGSILAAGLGVFLVFSIPSLALGQATVAAAIKASYQTVFRNFLAVSGLLLIIFLIRAGTPHALSIFTSSEWSVPFAIIVNAYVATGLIASLMLFFQLRAYAEPSATEGAPSATSG